MPGLANSFVCQTLWNKVTIKSAGCYIVSVIITSGASLRPLRTLSSGGNLQTLLTSLILQALQTLQAFQPLPTLQSLQN